MKLFHLFLAICLSGLIAGCAAKSEIFRGTCAHIEGTDDDCACGKKVFEKCRFVPDHNITVVVPK